MFKSLKKVVAIIVTLAFALSLVPGYAFASVEQPATVTERVGAVEYAYSRTSQSGVVAKDTAYKSTEYNGLHSVYMGGIYDAYMKMDLSGYEEILKNPSTTAEMRIEAGLQWSTARTYDYKGYVGPDAADVFTGDTITWNIANSLGLLREAEDNLLFIKSDGTVVDANNEGITPINMDVLLKALDEGPENSYVSIHIDGLPNTKGDNGNTANSTFRADAADTGIFITYDESEIDNQAYVDELAAGMKCEDVLGVSADNVSADLDLPAKWHGADVTWTSNNAAITNDGKVTQGMGDKAVTLTATLSYKGIGDVAETATKSFNVTVASIPSVEVKIPLTKPVYTRGGSHAGSYQGLSTYSSIILGSAPYRAYAQLDLTGYEEILRNPNTTVKFTAHNGAYLSTSLIRDFKVVVANESCDSYDNTTLTYNDAERIGLHNIDDRPVLFIDNDGVALGGNGKANEVSGPADINALLSGLNEGVDNSIVTICFVPLVNGDAFIDSRASATYLTISYYESEIDNEQYAKDMFAEFDWNKFSKEETNFVTSATKLPLEYKGLDVAWTSSDLSVVNPETGVITQTNEYKSINLTATLSYNGVTCGTKNINIRVSKVLADFNDINDGSEVLGTVNVTSTVEANGIGGKAADDSYVNFANTDSNPEKYYAFSTSTAAGQDDVFEFSALVPESSEGMHFYVGIFGTTGEQDSTRMTLPLTIKADGIYYGYISQGDYKIVDLDATKWNNYAIVAPKGMTGAVGSDGNSLDDETYEVYVNGVKVFEHKAQITNGGFAYIRIISRATSITDTIAYLDNIRIYSGDYVPAYDELPDFETTSGIVDENIVLEDASAKLADVIGAITVDEDAVIRVYDAEGNLVTDYTLPAVGKTIVVADRNGTTLERAYSVYNVVSSNGKDIIFGTPAVVYVNGAAESKISVLNYTNDTVTYNVYLAVYQNDELVKVVPATLTAEAGKTATVTPKASININQTVKLLVWDAEDGISPEIKPGQYN